MAQTYKRICIKGWSITAENGDQFEVMRGKEYITSPEINGHVTVYGKFWVPVPIEHFAGEIEFTKA